MNHRNISVNGRDIVICGREGDPYFENIADGDHTNDFLLAIIKRYLPEDAIVFDVGANIGFTAAVLALAAPNGRVIAFEPGERTFPLLLSTIEANQLTNCSAKALALGATKGSASFLSNSDSESASHLALDGVAMGGANSIVALETIDNIVEQMDVQRLDLIKIDVEGFEQYVIEGAQNTLAKLFPSVFVEFNAFTLIAFGNINPRHFVDKLRGWFPHVYRFRDGQITEIRDDGSALGLIHDVLTSAGCVEDLYCTFKPIDMAAG